MRHRQPKGPETDRPVLNHRVTSRLYPFSDGTPSHSELPSVRVGTSCARQPSSVPVCLRRIEVLVVHAVQAEFARTIEDVLSRRSRALLTNTRAQQCERLQQSLTLCSRS